MGESERASEVALGVGRASVGVKNKDKGYGYGGGICRVGWLIGYVCIVE